MLYGACIEYSDEAIKALERLPSNLARRIRDKIRQIAADPYAPNNNLKLLAGGRGYRLRVGDLRVIYELCNAVLLVHIITIAPRCGAYKD